MTACPAVEILLVEDDEGDAKLILHALKKANVSNLLHHVTDGAQALEFIDASRSEAADRRPRLILLDLKLPKVSGLEVLARLKGDARTKDIPVVVLTSSDQDGDVGECYKQGVNSYIVKPIDFERFAEAVAKVGLYWLLLNRAPR